MADAIDAINDAGLPVVAADVPSGVDAASGVVQGSAIRARATATFAAAKPGLWINPGKSHAGQVRVVDIGIPPGAPVEPPDVALIDDAALLALLPSRSAGWTKFTSGHVLVAGGSRGLTGAPSLAAEAAQRAGAGYVTACVPASQQAILAQRLLEAMTRGLPDDDGAHTADGADEVLELAGRGGALVVGPGLGRSDGAFAFARALVAARRGRRRPRRRRPQCPRRRPRGAGRPRRAHDPDAPRGRARAPARRGVLRRPGAASASTRATAAEQSQAIVVLKGDDTLVAEPGGRVAVSPGATGALATAGTGDVLSGVLAAVLSRDLDPFMAACAGVRLHARAGIHAAHDKGVDGVIARDVIEALPFAR